MAKRIQQGDSIIVDLRPMVHMDTHQNVCRRELRQMGNDTGIGVFALDAEDKLLLLPEKMSLLMWAGMNLGCIHYFQSDAHRSVLQ